MRQEPEQSYPSCLSLETILRHVTQPEHLTEEQCEAVSEHIARCPRCAHLYKAICDADAELWDEAATATGAPVMESVSTGGSAAEAIAKTWRQVEAYEAAERLKRRGALIFRIGSMAAAACVLIAISIGWIMMHKGGAGRSDSDIATNHGALPTAFAELVTVGGRKPLALNQPITTGAQPQEILLGGMHRVVMNRNTQATFSTAPFQNEGTQVGKVPYEIQLARGELYVEVVPGNSFTVKTANARLDITGTKFNVAAEGDKTELTLLKGSVRFSAIDLPHQGVSVTAGRASAIAGRSAPSAPVQANVVAITAWAKEAIMANALAVADRQMNTELSGLISDGWRQSVPADVDTVDYATWRKEHQAWCARQFPWIGKAQQVLHTQGFQADWIDVLIASGDVWQFHYDPKLPASQPLTRIEPITVARLARHYGVDEREMFRSVGLPDSMPIPTLSIQNPTLGEQYAAALERWQDTLSTFTQSTPRGNGDLMLFSLSAGRYLATTRTAAYLWAKAYPQQAKQLLAEAEYRAMLPVPLAIDGEDAWLEPLRQQAMTARSSAQMAMEWFFVPAGNDCVRQGTDYHRKLAALVAEMLLARGDQQ